MIQIEILESPDKDVETSFQFFHNAIYLGRTSGNLHIKDPGLNQTHLMIEVVESDLIIHPQKAVESYLLDGKRSTTVRKIKLNQKITIGHTTLKVIAFEETQFPSKKAILDQKLSQLIEQNSPRLSVIEKLSKLMK